MCIHIYAHISSDHPVTFPLYRTWQDNHTLTSMIWFSILTKRCLPCIYNFNCSWYMIHLNGGISVWLGLNLAHQDRQVNLHDHMIIYYYYYFLSLVYHVDSIVQPRRSLSCFSGSRCEATVSKPVGGRVHLFQHTQNNRQTWEKLLDISTF